MANGPEEGRDADAGGGLVSMETEVAVNEEPSMNDDNEASTMECPLILNATETSTVIKEKPEDTGNKNHDENQSSASLETCDAVKKEPEAIGNKSQDKNQSTARKPVEKKKGGQTKVRQEIEDYDLTPSAHPYNNLIDQLRPKALIGLIKRTRFHPQPLNKIQCDYVDTKEHLKKVCALLQEQKEIGVLGRYNRNEFMDRVGVLMISTRETTHLVDCVKLELLMHLLQPVFADPKIVKVTPDQRMLRSFQLEYNIWFVNVFCLKIAFTKLGWKTNYYRHLRTCYGLKTHGKYRKWLIRPLNGKHQKDAVHCVHYLLATYFKVVKMLPMWKLKPVLKQSNQKCALVAKYKVMMDFQFKNLGLMAANQAAVLCALDDWRHQVSQRENRSVHQVLGTPELRKLSVQMPTTAEGVLQFAHSPQVKIHMADIVRTIASLKGVIGPQKHAGYKERHDDDDAWSDEFDDDDEGDQSEGDSDTESKKPPVAAPAPAAAAAAANKAHRAKRRARQKANKANGGTNVDRPAAPTPGTSSKKFWQKFDTSGHFSPTSAPPRSREADHSQKAKRSGRGRGIPNRARGYYAGPAPKRPWVPDVNDLSDDWPAPTRRRGCNDGPQAPADLGNLLASLSNYVSNFSNVNTRLQSGAPNQSQYNNRYTYGRY